MSGDQERAEAAARDVGPAAVPDDAAGVEARIASWRRYILARGTLAEADADELEDHLRDELERLERAGLDAEEAFLIAIKRIGRQDEIAAEYARENARRLWKQLVLDDGAGSARGRRLGGAGAMLVFAVLAGLLAKAPGLIAQAAGLGWPPAAFLDGAVLALGALGAYLAWRRRAPLGTVLLAASGFALLLVLASAYPFGGAGDTLAIFVLHAPVLLWLLIGLLYAGAEWRSSARRMDFVRFTGEWAVYMALIALGGGVLLGLLVAVFSALGIDPSVVVAEWIAPCGAAGATVVAAWLVEAKQEVIENMAPVLGRIFTPLFAIAVLAMIVAACATGGFGGNRDVLIAVDALLVIVLGLVLYVLSAQSEASEPGWTERIQLLLVVAAFVLDGFALAAMLVRLGDGLTPNRLVALGVNAVLLVALAGSAWLQLRRLRRVDPSSRRLLAWHTGYLPVYAAWALLVAVAIPPVFAFA